MKDDALKIMRVKRVNRRCVQRVHRDTNMDPLRSGDISGECAQRFQSGEGTGELCDLQSSSRVRENDLRQAFSKYSFRGIDPEAEDRSLHLGVAIAEVEQMDLCIPASARLRFPLESQCIGRRPEDRSLNREATLHLLERAGGYGRCGTIPIALLVGTVVEDNMTVVGSQSLRVRLQ